MKKSNKYIILAVCNLLIIVFTLIIDWDSWGAFIWGSIVLAMIFVINPILTWILFRKDNNRLLRILIGLLFSIILFGLANDSIVLGL